MKKIMYSTVVLTCFTLSIVLFQISCQDEALANGNATLTQNRFLYVISEGNNNGANSEYWTANIDGTDHKQIPISLPAGLKLDYPLGGVLTPDGQTLIFDAVSTSTNSSQYIYSVSINGTNLKKLKDVSVLSPDGNTIILNTY